MSIKDGTCFGRWDMRHPACKRCLAEYASRCEKETKRRRAKQSGDGKSKERKEEERISFNERFMDLLEVSLKKTVRWGKPIRAAYFHDASGEKVAYVAYHSVTGRMKVVTEKKPGGEMYSLSSNDEAEDLAKEVLGGG